jgi:hypothetical protein
MTVPASSSRTTGARLLVFNPCSSPCVQMAAKDSRSAHGLLYLAAVRADRRKQDTVKARLTLILCL